MVFVCSPEGLVYRYNPNIHNIEQAELEKLIEPDWSFSISIDHGDVNPFVAQLWCWPPDKSVLYLYKEIYLIEEDLDKKCELIQNLISYIPSNNVLSYGIGDHDRGKNLLLSKYLPGIQITPADKADLLGGLEIGKTALNNGKVKFNITSLIHDPYQKLLEAAKPIRTVEEFERYSYRDESQMNGSENDEKPLKNHDHGMDAYRYQIVEWTDQTLPPLDFKGAIIDSPRITRGF